MKEKPLHFRQIKWWLVTIAIFLIILTNIFGGKISLESLSNSRNSDAMARYFGYIFMPLAHELGVDWSQKKISLLEQKESIEDNILRQVSDILHIPVEAFRNFDEEQEVNTFDNGSIRYQKNDSCTFNPVEQIIKLHEEKIALYERMLKEKDEMMARLERLIGG